MKKIDNVLIADDGMKLTDGEGFYSKVCLSNIDSADRYSEVAISQANEILESEGDIT
jgi:hypothetical protein